MSNLPRSRLEFSDRLTGLLTVKDMKNIKRTTRLTVETEGTYIFRTRSSRQTRWCEQCGEEAEMAFVDEAAAVSGLKEMTIYQSIEARSLHVAEDESGRVLICLNSLQD